MIPARIRHFANRFLRWSTKTPRRKAAWVLLVAYLVNQFVYPLIPFLKDNTVHANGVIEPVALGTSLFVNRNPEFNVWFGDRLDQSKHKITFEVGGGEIEMRLRGTSNQELGASDEIDQLIANLRKELQKPYLTTTNGNDSIDQKIGDKATIRYEILPDRGVKESILIQELGARSQEIVSNRFIFDMKLSNGVQLKSKLENLNNTNLNASSSSYLLNANSYYFVDNKGKYLAHFEPLVMTDAAGAMSNDIKMDISDNTLTITANQEWLSSPDRVFPIDLDPTIVHDQNPDFSSGTENRTQVNSGSAVEGQYKELQSDINTVGLWHFNEGSGTTAYDASGNNNTGTLTNGPVWNGPTDTQVGLGKSSLKFNGISNYATVPNDSKFSFGTADFSVETWIYPTTVGVSQAIIGANSASPPAGQWYFRIASNNKLEFGHWTAADNYSNSTLSANQWSHVAVTRTGSTLMFYINGILDYSGSNSYNYSNTAGLLFGTLQTTTGFFNGTVDEVRISNRARTPEEIAASASRFPYSVHESPVIDFGSTPNTLDSLNYTATGVRTGDGETPYSRDGLVAQWNFNETSGTTAYNMAGNDSCGGTPSSCNLTLNNFASTASQDQAAGTGWTANDKRWGAGSINVSSVATADTLSLSNPSTLDPNSADLSVETWVKTTDVTAELFSNNSANGVSCTSDGYYLGIDASGYPVFTLDTDGATAGCDATITSGITKKVNDGNWHHLAATVTRGSGAYLYMDGALIGSDTSITAYASEAPSGNVLVGSTNNFDGTLDSLRFYARALTSTEVLANTQVGNIEFQTRTGTTSTPNDGTWEAWKTTTGTGDTQIAALDNVADIATPSASIWQGVPIATSSSALVMEGTGSLRTKIGAPQVEQSVAALWHLDETSGTGAYIQDSSATNADGTPTGTSVVDGFYGKGRSFNGSSDYIAATMAYPSSTMTLSLWYYTTDISGNIILSGDSNLIFHIYSGNYRIGHIVSGTDWAPSYPAKTNTWTHVAYVQNGNTATIYENGVSLGSGTSTLNPSGSTVWIGNANPSTYNNPFNGKLDEVKIDNVVRTADEIAEAYRSGANHRLSKTISSANLSSSTKLPFYVASDRPGTFLEATVGESAFANYEPDANTRGLWHLEEQTGSGAYIKDSSGNGNNGTPTGTTFVQGKIGKGRSFNGTSDYINAGTNAIISGTTYSASAWFKTTATARGHLVQVYASEGGNALVISMSVNAADGKISFYKHSGVGGDLIESSSAYNNGIWHFAQGVRNGANMYLYIDGSLVASSTTAGTETKTASQTYFGTYDPTNFLFNGSIDEVRLDNTTHTADEIRQAFEVGKRTHPITIDFKADLDSSNLITSTSDLSFAIQPDIDIVGAPLSVARGEKIIVKENVNGTEYLAQGTTSAITYEDGTSNPNAQTQNLNNGSVTTVTVTSWDSGSTVPSGGFTTAATVFKWQREYFDLTQITQSTHRDAMTRITMRVTDGSQGSNVWLDDFESADYSDGSRVAIGSTVNRYFQYRAILNASSSMLSPSLNNVTINYNSGTTAQAPKVKDASSDFSATGTSLNRVTDTGSSNSPSLELAYKELPKDINTVALYHMNEASGNLTDSSGNGLTGTDNSTTVTTTAQKLGSAARTFNGTTSYVSLGTDSRLFPTKGTIETWIYMTSLPGATNTYIVYSDNATNVGRSLEVDTNDNNNCAGATNQLFAWINTDNGGGTNYFACSGVSAKVNTWYHLAMTYDVNSLQLNFFVDGVLTKTTTYAGNIRTTSLSATIGRYGTSSSAYFGGTIDELRISNIARTPEEIKYDAGHRPYGVYTSDVQNLGTQVSSIDNLRWTENGVQTGDAERPFNDNGLVAQWNFNETSGTAAAVTSTSSCGSTCNGTLTTFASTTSQDQAAGTGWTANNKRWGAGAIMTDGSNDYVACTDANCGGTTKLDFDATTNFSIEAWIKTNTSGYMAIVNKGNTAGANAKYNIAVNSSTNYLRFQLADGTDEINAIGTTALNDGKWHYVVATFDNTNAKVYVDSRLENTTSGTAIDSLDNTVSAYIGAMDSGGSPGGYFNGTIDSTRIYSRALSAVEVLSNYQAGNVELQTRTGTTTTPNDGTWEEWRPSGNSTEVQLDNLQTLSPVQKINTSNLVGYWKLDEVSGNRADSAGSNTLTDNATVTSKNGHLNLAGQFTAANSEYLSITDNAALTTGDIDYTGSAWVYLDSYADGRYILAKGNGAVNFDYALRTNSSRFEFLPNANGGTELIGATSLGLPTTKTWYFIVFWHDSVANTINIQVNNGAVDSKAEPAIGTSTTGLSIGSERNFSFWDGRIDEVAIWKRVLTADERRILYEDGLDKTNDSVVGGINRTSDTTTKFEGTGSEKLTIGAPQVDSSTVALWHMDETSGSGAYIQDSTANNNDGTPTGTTVVDGFYGKGRSFNGSSDYINMGDQSSLESMANLSVEAWFKTTTTALNKALVAKYWTGTVSYILRTDYTTAGKIEFEVMGASSPTSISTSSINDGKWHYVVGTYDGSNQRLYVDGVLEDTDANSGAINNSEEKFTIGAAEDGSGGYNAFFNGTIDEVRISNTARTADEIAEGYRAGRDHRVSKTLNSNDLSSKTKLPFYVASDRPGTFMEATVGESAYANYEPDANTVGLWHLEEALDASGSIKDSSGLGNNLTLNSAPTFVQGKIGKARNFDDSADYASCTDANCGGTNKLDYPGSGGWTVGAWINPSSIGTNDVFIGKTSAYWLSIGGTGTNCTAGKIGFASYSGAAWTCASSNTSPTANNWYYVVGTYDGTNLRLYVNGVLDGGPTASTAFANSTENFNIGGYSGGWYFPGIVDEGSVSNIARTADEIRQAYEIGKRTHQITNDFVTTPQAAYSSGTSVTINNPYGTTNLTDTLSIGDTIIFKENVGGTETVSQAVVTAITNTSSVYGTVTLLAAPTFPSGGYTTNATVFKWQREFVDISQIRPMGQIDAINRITLRVTDGSQGANIWIDDIKAAGPYLTQSTTRTASVSSTVRQYLQYRIIFSTTDPQVSPTVTSVSVQTHSSPVKVVGSDTLGADGSFDKDGNLHLGSNNVKKVAFYDRTKDQISYALDFDNSNDYVAVGTGPTSVKTVEFWVNPNSTSTEFIDLNGSAYINVSSGTIGTTGFTSPTVYVDGAVTSTVVANKWQHIAVTTGTGLNATALNFGKRSTSYFNGIMDEVALYSSALTAAQVTTDYNIRRLAGTETGLVALYHFDEGQGTRAYDSVGGFHGTLTNMTATAWVNSQNDRDQSALSQQTLGVDPNWGNGPTRESNALLFNGSSDYIGVGSGSSLQISTLSTEAWIIRTTLGTTNAEVITSWGTGGWGFYVYENGVSGGRGNKLGFGKIGASECTDPNTSLDQINIWYHVAITYDTSNCRFYVNGALSATVAYSDPTFTFGTTVSIGQVNSGSYFPGVLDEVAIFNTARTAAQISSDYNSRRFKGNETGLVALWHMDEGAFNLCSGGTNDICDASSNTNDGAATGTTWVTDARAVMDNNARYVSLGSSTSANTDKGMEIYAISTTQFKYRWTGDQTWSSAVNFSSYPFATPAQLGTTGVYVGFDTTNGVFGDESYFLIPSWAIQQFSTTRGVRRTFPERSYLVATDRSVDIIDADDNTLWMRTSNGVSGQLLGTQTLNIPSGITMTQGQLMVSTNGTAGTGVYRLDFNRDTAYRYNTTNRTNGTNNLAKRNATDWSWGSADTGQNLIDSIVNDVSLLVINGKCVTGDTLLRRRRRKNGKWVYDDVRIDEIEIGDEIMSLNEKTGKFEWQVVEAKKNMGVKDTWQIITESGKKIRATSDHKFLSSVAHSRSGTFEVDQSNRIEDLARDTYIAITGHGHTNITMVKSAIKREVFDKYYKKRQKLFGPMMWARVVNHLLVESQIQNAKIILDIEYSNYNKLIEQIVTNGVKNISVEFKSIGKESPAHIAVWTANRKARKTTGASGITQTAKDVLHPEFTGIRTSSSRNLSGDYQNLAKKSSPVWTETANLASNCWIATESGWEKVKVVYKVAHETVWDIRVSKNHNFVGNGLVAHNCMLATANNTGLTKIANIMSNDTSYDYSDVTSNAYNRVRMAENYLSGTGAVGDMYALNSTNNALERWNNVVADTASEANGTPDATVNATSTPALFASAQTVNDLDVKTGTSLASAGNNTVFVAHNGGTTTFQEHRTTLASSSVKYYTKDYIGEEMVGDIRGSWSLNGLTDNSLKAQTLTNNGSVTFTTSGVRGLAPTLNGSSQYLSVADNANFSITGALTIGAWIYPTSLAGDKVVISKWGTSQQSYLLYIPSSTNKLNLLISSSGSGWTTATGNTALQTNQWYFVSAVFTPSSKMEVFVNGVSDGSNTTSIPASIYDSTPGLGIGWDTPNGIAGEYFAGIIDEPFVTATALSATQIQQLYVAGKEALNNKYRVKLASDTVNQLAGTINVVKGVAASDQYIFAGTNTTGADDGILSRVLLRGDVTDKTYDESSTDPLIVDNDINSVAVSKDGAYIIVGTDDQGITIIHNGSATNRLRSGGKVQGPSKRPSN